jgi:aldehyde dehydrogenase (NAD+)
MAFEVNMLTTDLEHTLANIKSWAKPRKVDTPMMVGPASSYIVNEPFGVSLVIGPWNYPISTTLQPLIASIAAGNCVLVKPSEMSSHTSGVIKALIEKYLDPDCYACVEGGPLVA